MAGLTSLPNTSLRKARVAPYSRRTNGIPAGENRFASSNRHRTKKNAFSIFQGKGNTARDEPMLPNRD